MGPLGSIFDGPAWPVFFVPIQLKKPVTVIQIGGGSSSASYVPGRTRATDMRASSYN